MVCARLVLKGYALNIFSFWRWSRSKRYRGLALVAKPHRLIQILVQRGIDRALALRRLPIASDLGSGRFPSAHWKAGFVGARRSPVPWDSQIKPQCILQLLPNLTPKRVSCFSFAGSENDWVRNADLPDRQTLHL